LTESTGIWRGTIHLVSTSPHTLESQFNTFTKSCLDSMGIISQLAKSDGLIVSLAPAQSYLNPSSTSFSRSLQFAAPSHPEFSYHGLNTYAYLLARYGRISDTPTFDFVTIQFYESFSDLHHTISTGTPPSTALIVCIKSYLKPWTIDFRGTGVEWEQSAEIVVEKIVIGLANGWAKGSDRAVFIETDELKKAWKVLKEEKGFVGFGFWTIGEEGRDGFWLVDELNAFMGIRDADSRIQREEL
jgi:hypothetical protein